MYLDNGREIYESDDYPGYFIDANTGAWCDERGNYIGGNKDNGDKPGMTRVFDEPRTVFVSKSGKYYYPKPCKSAAIPVSLNVARTKGYRPSRGYGNYIAKELNRKNKLKNKV